MTLANRSLYLVTSEEMSIEVSKFSFLISLRKKHSGGLLKNNFYKYTLVVLSSVISVSISMSSIILVRNL
jgi:hypothetical protein